MSIFKQFPYIVVEGPIGCGKTTLAKKLVEHFNVTFLSEQADQNPFLARFYENKSRYALQTQLFFMLQRAEQIKMLNNRDMHAQPVVADFFLEKDPLFAKLNLDDDEYAIYQKIYQDLQLKATKPDLVIYLQSPIDALVKRILERNISYEMHISREYLKELTDAYNHFFHNYESTRVLIVNNEKLNIAQNDAAFELLINRIAQISSNREFFNPNFD